MKKIVGKVTQEECDLIHHLFERKNGLSELVKIIDMSNAELYEKVVDDLGNTTNKFQQWWDSMAKKYCWESVDCGHWEIDFETCEIFLVE